MTIQTKNTRRPANMEIKKGQAVVERVLQENVEWLKEMATK